MRVCVAMNESKRNQYLHSVPNLEHNEQLKKTVLGGKGRVHCILICARVLRFRMQEGARGREK
jgi:hypothetical protein